MVQQRDWPCKVLVILNLLLLWLLGSSQIENKVSALKVSVSIPELVKLNDPFWLNCSHHRAHLDLMEPKRTAKVDEIYAIKWYKDDEEFYRFLPNAEPKISVYETNGIQLDQAKSHEGNLLMSKADVNSEGVYRCEILSEAPLFETVRKSKHLKVYALPVRGPRIEILDPSGRPKSPKAQEISYAVGDKIELRCNSAPSKPAARLRWYLNDHELPIPPTTGANSTPGASRERRNLPALDYDVSVTPIEYRQHFKGIYSSHSTLSLVLQQDDLINNKISFKCLASMRRDVPVRSKQLILLRPPSSTVASPALSKLTNLGPRFNARRRRSLGELVAMAGAESDGGGDGTHAQHRQRPQNHRHSMSRLTSVHKTQAKFSADLISNLADNSESNSMMYVYEDSDSTMGPSSIDALEDMQTRLRAKEPSHSDANDFSDNSTKLLEGNNYVLDFNKADNLEYVQLLRDRTARQRSYPSWQQSQTQAHHANGGSHNSRRLPGANALVKSPLYLDELDTMRPLISWPPLESGKLLLLPPSKTIVAIPTQSLLRSLPSEQKFVLPPKADMGSGNNLRFLGAEDDAKFEQTVIERLIQNLNCTCVDGSIDTKLVWFIDDTQLDLRDTRLFPARISQDHRQTWITVGFHSLPAHNPSISASDSPPRFNQISTPLKSVLNQFLNKNDPQSPSNETYPATGSQQQSETSRQIRFSCQAIHSMLLYSSSEMITFDFNPPPLGPIDGNAIDKFGSSPSNVIQATSAPQSSSAKGVETIHTIFLSRSQTTGLIFILSLLHGIFIPRFVPTTT